MKQPLLRCLALVLSLLLLLAPAHAQVLRGTFAASASHSLSIRADGTLWAAGDNQYGQLGIPLGTSRSSAWVQVGTAANWVMVAAGRDFTLGLRADGSLWAWGNNHYGQLGSATGTGADRPNPTPTRVGTDLYTQVAASDSHSLGLRADGSLWAWGYNSYGELGYATNASVDAPNSTPAQVGTGVYTQVATGTNHTLALRADGTLYAWGRNYNGQLGYGTNAGTNTPTYTPLPVGTARYSQLAAGGAHSLALRADGTLWAWGSNFYGQLGNPDRNATLTPTQVGTALYTQVAAGGDHSLGVRADGSLYAWGLNYSGELGNDVNLGAFVANTTPTPVGTGRYVQVAAGYYHSLGLRADGSLWAWGSTGYGKLGTTAGNSDGALSTPTATGTALPTRSTAASNNFGLAVRADGTLWAWGDNSLGQFGDGTTTSSLLPKQVGTDRDWVQVTAGQFFGMGLKANGTLWAWGYNSRGQLGTTNLGLYVANPTPIRVGTDLYTRVAAGTLHCLGLRADGTLWAWGDNYNGQLGNSTNSGTSASNPTPAQVGTGLYTQAAAGGTHSLGLRADGTLWAWGDNGYGQLGVNNRLVTNPVPRQVGTDLYQQAAAGNGYTLGLRATGSLYAWGSNQAGQLGNTTNAGTAASNPTPRQVGSDVYTQVAVGSSHSLGLRADGSLWTWGANYESELGQGATGGYNPTPTQEATLGTGWASLAPGPASFFSLVRTASGLTFASAGLNSAGQLGDGTTTDANRFDRLRPLGTIQPLPVLAAAPTAPGLALFPNPAPARATTLLGAAPGAPVLVLDALGRQVLAATADAAGSARLRLPAALAPGVYLVRTGRHALRLSVE